MHLVSVASEENRANVFLDDVVEAEHADLRGMRVRGRDRAKDNVQIEGMQGKAVRALNQPFCHGGQLGEIAAPGKEPRCIQQVQRKLGQASSGLAGDPLQHESEDLRNIFAAVAQRWNDDAEGSERICQLCGKTACADQRAEAALRKCNQARGLRSMPA